MSLLNWSLTKKDLGAGFIVFLIALPLSIGIAIASGAPPTAGIISAIVGGMIGSLISGSYVTINGPAAGLIVVVLACVEEMGRGNAVVGYQMMLACTVAVGCVQVVLGLLKAGTLGFAFPSTVVHAMLSAIGLIIISKQAHVLMGVAPAAKSPLSLFAEIPKSLLHSNETILLIGGASLAALILLNSIKSSKLRFLPPPLVAVLVGVGLGLYFDLEHTHTVSFVLGNFDVGPQFLLNVPANISAAFVFPDFSEVFSFLSIKHIVIMTFIASTESILSAFAVDKMDPLKRKSNMNTELKGKGVANVISGLLGGLPMISEIVRSTANIANGAQTQRSNFFHGLFLLLFIGLFPTYLHLIPLSSLAAILLYVGYQLAKPSHFMHAKERGWDQGLVFVVTVATILATDLLVGVAAGALLEYAVVAYRSRSFRIFKLLSQTEEADDGATITIQGSVAFTNYLSLRRRIDQMSELKMLKLDMRGVSVVDQTVMEHLQHHILDFSNRGRTMELEFSHDHQPVSSYPLASRVRVYSEPVLKAKEVR